MNQEVIEDYNSNAGNTKEQLSNKDVHDKEAKCLAIIKTFFSKYKREIIIGPIAFVIFVFLIPLIINWLYTKRAPCAFLAVNWTANDALAFYGSLLAAAIGVVGTYWSIQAGQTNYRKDKINEVKPYFSAAHYETSSRTSLFADVSRIRDGDSGDNVDRTSGDYYKEYKPEKLYIVIDKKGITFPNGFNSEQQKIIKSSGLCWITNDKEHCTLHLHDFVSIPFDLENIGKGTALDVKIAFYKKGEKPYGKRFFAIKPTQVIYCHIFSDNSEQSLLGEYILEIRYADILENYYSQKFFVDFGLNAETGKFHTSMTLIAKQEVIHNGQT